MSRFIHVTNVSHVKGYTLHVAFSDGTSGEGDFIAELDHKEFVPLRNVATFAEAYVDGGTVCWPGNLNLAVERVYALVHGLKAPADLDEARANEQTVSLRELRRIAGKTQVQLAEASGMDQGELSRFERRGGHTVSTVRRYVEALGGELEIVAVIGDKRVALRGI